MSSVPDPGLPPPPDTGKLLLETLGAINRADIGDSLALLNESGLTIPQMVACHVLRMRSPRAIGEIASCIKLSPAATSHMVDRLVSRGLVERTEDPRDRRQKAVTLTQQGRDLADRLVQSRVEVFRKSLALLPEDLRAEFAAVLVRVAAALQSLPPVPGSPCEEVLP